MDWEYIFVMIGVGSGCVLLVVYELLGEMEGD